MLLMTDAEIRALARSGALANNAAQFAQPRGADLIRRTGPLEAWCALRAAHGVWQYARALEGPPQPLAEVREEGGRRAAGLNFASQDYLSLGAHPAVRDAAVRALRDAGPHSAGSAVLLGNSRQSLALEKALTCLLGHDHVTLFPTGWGAAFGAITALVHARDHVVIDQLAHASLRQGAAAATRNIAVHRHLDCSHVRDVLATIRSRDRENGILVVTEGLFSMDSDSPDLPLLQHVCHEYGATLLVDVAHDLGALGPNGAGIIGQQGMLGKVDIVLGAFSKTFAANGGFVASASHGLKRQLQLFAGPHLFSNALSPVQAAVVLECLRIVQSSEGAVLRTRLLSNVSELRSQLADAGLRCLGLPSAIVPVLLGSEPATRLAGKLLARAGVFVNPVEYPGVPLGRARLRLQLMSGHEMWQVRQAAQRIATCVRRIESALAVPPALEVQGG
ncbi:aminotransferase class I/II-fold pyridoxal phosphate-dependent enzyme [Massilia horti]|uniref:Aminotransferase class I/II-fold pyridoxal phosphate-dependent enzyme n=2 Tax=Massilia horti TaxID=2562153 RepID=A0A4Y9SZC0_9BURK|nr:aminotransferase class I/II-fold pyridoxal phosphate-dependent enzyme [Massilia horti]